MESDRAEPQASTPPREVTGEYNDHLPKPLSTPPPTGDIHVALGGDDQSPNQPRVALDPKSGPVEVRADADYQTTPRDFQAYSAENLAADPLAVIQVKPLTVGQLPEVIVGIKRDYLRDVGTLLIALAAVVIAVLAYLVNKNQAESLKNQTESLKNQAEASDRQATAARDDVNVKFIEEFRKHLGELTLPESETNEENLKKKRLAAITLAQYGERALPVLKMSLALDDEDIRGGAVVVVVQMLSDKTLRPVLLAKLKEYFDEDSAGLRIGVLDCYLTVNRGLTDQELNDAKKKITEHVTPSSDYSDKPEEQRVLLWATKFFSNWPSLDSRNFLLAVAKNSTGGNDAREGAINYLPSVTMAAQYASDTEREKSKQEVSAGLQALLIDAPERLRTNLLDAIQKIEGTN